MGAAASRLKCLSTKALSMRNSTQNSKSNNNGTADTNITVCELQISCATKQALREIPDQPTQ